jgi:hypothetical protein
MAVRLSMGTCGAAPALEHQRGGARQVRAGGGARLRAELVSFDRGRGIVPAVAPFCRNPFWADRQLLLLTAVVVRDEKPSFEAGIISVPGSLLAPSLRAPAPALFVRWGNWRASRRRTSGSLAGRRSATTAQWQ